MPGVVATRTGRYSVLTAELAGAGEVTAGVLLEDPDTGQVWVRLRRDWHEITDDEQAEVLELLEDDLNVKARQMGGAAFFTWMEDTLSNAVRVSDRSEVLLAGGSTEAFARTLNGLYRRHVQTEARPFVTHLPRYTLRAAAGRFLENEEVEQGGWEEAPRDLRLASDMFVAEIAGHSMEPVIPNGSLAIFRANPGGTRQGKLVLAEDRQSTGFNRYSVKRYKSEKALDQESGRWTHTRIRLESLNPDYPSWDLDEDPGRYAIVAEFVCVLE